ncbi:hypothetical protein GCK72_020848 [Caenorhabditis remanei]|uniref:Calpain catalytic domain-containing protein n=1 Tax=Caenorhabditis remanei TaxID=31234 RepID=A0A6A5GGE6_CAERE|nr:hypothetical protein GCK72_020848 [Caenorhabditis remanei]KAF1754288.1 hypothetical protein GCK72_020848 [Caenorhabditis remanei]
MTVCTRNQDNKILEECHQWVRLFLRNFGPDDIFFDAEIEYSDGSLKWDEHGTMLYYNVLKKHGTRPISVYQDSWPIHAEQGRIGDCWLIAPLMTIARKRKLLEWIIPQNDFSLKHGIFLVRLFIKGEWTIVVVDGHFPCTKSGRSQFAILTSSELWSCLIEKAIAKMLGGYHMLNGGHMCSAFQWLTGASCLTINLNIETNLEMLWEKLKEFQSLGYLMVTSTLPNVETKYVSQNGLGTHHAYSVFETCVHEGHRLVLIGGTNGLKWKGKWSELPPYNDDVTEKWAEWMKKAIVGLVNIHKATSDNKIGEIVISSSLELYWCPLKAQYRAVETDPFELADGVYFVVITVFYNRYLLEYSWIIRSAIPTDHISCDTVTFENDVVSHLSLLKMVETFGKSGIQYRKGLFLQKYSRNNFLTMKAENQTEKPIDIIIFVKSKAPQYDAYGIVSEPFWNKYITLPKPYVIYTTIPPKSKCILGNVWKIPEPIELKSGVVESEMSYKYWIRILEEEIKSGRAKEMRYAKCSGIYKAVSIN